MEDTEDINNTDDIYIDDSDSDNFINSKNIIIITDKNKMKSRNRLTKYELTRIIGTRKTQLQHGAKALVIIKSNNKVSYEEIAIQEFINGVLPFKLVRRINNIKEIWELTDLKYDHLDI